MAYALTCQSMCHGMPWYMPWYGIGHAVACHGVCHSMRYSITCAMKCHCMRWLRMARHVPWHAIVHARACATASRLASSAGLGGVQYDNHKLFPWYLAFLEDCTFQSCGHSSNQLLRASFSLAFTSDGSFPRTVCKLEAKRMEASRNQRISLCRATASMPHMPHLRRNKPLVTSVV